MSLRKCESGLPVGWKGAVVYIVQRRRKTADGVEYDLSLESIHASVESARERIAILEAGDYNALIETEPIYTNGGNVVPIEVGDHPSRA
jgi:hypothetical protein